MLTPFHNYSSSNQHKNTQINKEIIREKFTNILYKYMYLNNNSATICQEFFMQNFYELTRTLNRIFEYKCTCFCYHHKKKQSDIMMEYIRQLTIIQYS